MTDGELVVVGATGFIGSAIVHAARLSGLDVRTIHAARLTTRARDLGDVFADVDSNLVDQSAWIDRVLATRPSAVVNAAGIASAAARATDALFGANSVLPGVLARACSEARVRFVHVSSAGVQGRVPVLDESPSVAPISPYSTSKALGEAAVGSSAGGINFRPTSVHGRQRRLTRQLVRFAGSSLASVAGDGEYPTPQTLVENVASAITHVATYPGFVPSTVLQPSEGLTAASILRILGGREPRHVPVPAAQAILWVSNMAGRLNSSIAAAARRLEMLWFGQTQACEWLAQSGWCPQAGLDEWAALQWRG